MLRTIKISVLGALVLSVASAGTINNATPVDLAGVALPAGDISATISGCMNVATGAGQGCSAPTPTGNGYMNLTFSSILPAGTTPPVTSNVNQNVTTGISATPFLLASEPDNNNQLVDVGGAATDSQVVMNLGGYNPISNAAAGVFDVSDVYTMIQGNLMSMGDQGLTVMLNGLTSLGAAASYEFVLTAGTDYRGTNSKQTITSDIAGGGTTQTTATDSNPDSGNGCLLNNVVTAGCSIIVNNSAFGGTASGHNFYLDVQELVLPSVGNPFANGGLLQSITISSDAFGTGNTNQAEGLFLSGVSLVTPEPGTIALLGAGLGLIALRKRLRSKTTV
jgi:PEP-CTERM motif